MVGAMYLAVTVRAVPGNLEACTPGIGSVKIQHVTDMGAATTKTFGGMALLAELWSWFV